MALSRDGRQALDRDERFRRDIAGPGHRLLARGGILAGRGAGRGDYYLRDHYSHPGHQASDSFFYRRPDVFFYGHGAGRYSVSEKAFKPRPEDRGYRRGNGIVGFIKRA